MRRAETAETETSIFNLQLASFLNFLPIVCSRGISNGNLPHSQLIHWVNAFLVFRFFAFPLRHLLPYGKMERKINNKKTNKINRNSQLRFSATSPRGRKGLSVEKMASPSAKNQKSSIWVFVVKKLTTN